MVQFTGLAANGANNTDGEGAKRWRRAVTADGADAGTALLPTADHTLVRNVHVCTLHTCTLHSTQITLLSTQALFTAQGHRSHYSQCTVHTTVMHSSQ